MTNFDIDLILQFLNDNAGYIKYIIGALVILLDLVVIAGALIYMGFGFWFGTRKSLRRLLTFLIPFTILVVIANPISYVMSSLTVGLLKTDLGKMGIDYLEELIATTGYSITINLEEFPETIKLISSIIYTVCRFSILTIGFLIIMLVITPLTRYISWLTYRIQMNGKKEVKKTLVSRFTGMAIATLRYAFVLLIVVLPIHGVISSTSLILEDVENIASAEIIEDENFEEVKEILDTTSSVVQEINTGLNFSLTRQAIKKSRSDVTGISFDIKYLGQFTEIKIDDVKFNILEEYGTIHKLFPLALEVANIYMEEDIQDILNHFTIEDVENLEYVLQNVNLLKLLMPTALELSCNIVDLVDILDEYNIDIQQIKQIDINKDYSLVVDATGIVLKAIVVQNLDFDSTDKLIENILNNEVINQKLKQFITDILETDTINKLVLPMAVKYLNDEIDNLNDPIYNELKEFLTFENIDSCLRNDISSLFEISKILYNSQLQGLIKSLINGEEITTIELDFTSNDFKEDILSALTKLMNLSIIQGHEESLIKLIVNSSTSVDINLDEILYDENGNKVIDWSSEITLIVDAVFETLSIIGTDFENLNLNVLQDKLLDDQQTVEDLIDTISKSDIARALTTTLIPYYLSTSSDIPEEISIIFSESKFKGLQDKDKFATEIKLLLSSLNNFVKLGLFDYETFSIANVNKELLKSTILDLLNSYFIKDNEEKLIELVVELTELSSVLDEYNIDLDEIFYDEHGNKLIDWSKETELILDALIDTFSIIEEDIGGITLEILQEKLLSDVELRDNLVDTIAKSDIARSIITNLLPKLLQNNKDIPDGFSEIFTEEKFNELKDETKFATEIKLLLGVFNDLIEAGVFDFDNFEINEENQKLLKAAILDLLNSCFVKDNEEKLIYLIIDLADLTTILETNNIDLDEIFYDEEGNKLIDWSKETELILDAVFEIINVLGTDFNNITLETLQEKLLSDVELRDNLVDTIAKSDIARSIITNLLPKLLQNSKDIPQEFLEFFSEEKFYELKDEEIFATEIKLLLGIFDNMINSGILDFDTFVLSKDNQEIIKTTMKDLLKSHFIKGSEEKLVKLLVETTNFSSILEANNIILDYSNVTSWQKEMELIIDIACDFLNISTSDEFDLSNLFNANMEEEEIENVALLFDKIGKSELFNPVIYQLIDNVGYDLNLTDSDKAKIDANGWYNEIKSLLLILGDAQELLENNEDLTSLKGKDVEKIMLEASNGIITSKVVGGLLDTALGEDGLGINTVDENGNPKYDFTDPELLKNEASNIANLIDLANSLNSVDLENKDSITSITEAMSNLENNELAQDFVKEIVGEDVDIKEIANDANIVNQVYEEYQQSDDKENFTLDPDSQLAKDVQNSDLAQIILGLIGII